MFSIKQTKLVESFRLYLQKDEMAILQEHLQSLVSTGNIRPGEPLYHVLKKITKLTILANAGAQAAAYVRKPNLKESLDLAGESEDNVKFSTNQATLTPIEKRNKAYHKWVNTPALCTPDEIEMAQTYRWENELMSEEERIEYESNLF